MRTTTKGALVFMFVAAATTGNCSRRSLTDGADVGAVNLALTLPGGDVVNSVSYQIVGNGINPINGVIDVSEPGKTEATVLVSNLPAGMYTVTMTANSNLAHCLGSTPFTVVANQTAMALVVLQCQSNADRPGRVAITGRLDQCPLITGISATSLSGVIGGPPITVSVSASELDTGDVISYSWTATPSGVGVLGPNAATTTFICTAMGSTQLSIAVSDGVCGDQLMNAIPITCGRGAIGGSGGGAGTGGGGGNAGAGGSVVLNDTCAAGPPSTSCSQGTASVGTVVHGQGFDAYNGHVVTAALSSIGPVVTRSTTISGGAFDVDLLLATTTCNLGVTSSANAALFVDVNGDGTCGPAADLIYVWTAVGGPAGTCALKTLTPASQPCMATDLHDIDLLAVHTVCPSLTCSPVCSLMFGGGGSSICSAPPPDCFLTETNPPLSLIVSCSNCLLANYNPPTDGCCGIAADPTGFSLCDAASKCMRAGGPPVGQCNVGGDVTTCYCGTNLSTCATGGANGPCVAQMAAAAGRNVTTMTTDAPTPAAILSRQGDPSYALGRAANIHVIAAAFCPAECGF